MDIGKVKKKEGDDTQKGSTLNPEILTVVEIYSQELIRLKQVNTPVHADEIASTLARFYEKIRKIIDWKDDNALRRGAIERILKRILFPKMVGFSIKVFDPKVLAETVTHELIRGGHLPNHSIPRSRIEVVSKALVKYLYFLDDIFNHHSSFDVKKKTNLTMFVLEIAACEVEEILTRPVKELGLIKAMSKILSKRIVIYPTDSMTYAKKLEYTTISAQKKLYHLDNNYIIYHILRSNNRDWQNPSLERIQEISKGIPSLHKDISKDINGLINREFDIIAEEVDTVFMLLDDVLDGLKDKPEKIVSSIENQKKYIKLLTEAYEKRNKTLKTRLRNAAIFSTLSVFISNWATFYLFEVPLARLFYERFNLIAAVVDFLVPTLVMFILIAMIKTPRRENLERVIKASRSFIYTGEGEEEYQVKTVKKRRTTLKLFMSLAYLIISGAIFVSIAYVFYIAKLPITSVIYDTFTIALTVYAAVVVRIQSKELVIGEDRNFWGFLLDFLTIPLAKVGSFLSRKWKEYNIVAMFFNYVIEIPFVSILNFIQAWGEYIKEKKSEVN